MILKARLLILSTNFLEEVCALAEMWELYSSKGLTNDYIALPKC